MGAAVVLFTRDLRVHDNPVLHASLAANDRVVPLFVRDAGIHAPRNRERFLAQSLADLRTSLRERGGDLVILSGDPVIEAVRIAKAANASAIFVARDASGYAAARQRRLAQACAEQRLALEVRDSVTIVPPGALRPAGNDHYRVFTPYWRAWRAASHRPPVAAPDRVTVPEGIASGRLPAPGRRAAAVPAGELMDGGETQARLRLQAWAPKGAGYAQTRDDLAADATSRMSPYLHFGCVSPTTVASTVQSEEYLRQLCWRDFYHQVLHAFPDLPRRNYRRSAPDDWRDDPTALQAWQEGRTGVPIVDAGMRQLAAEGWLHNRARLITGSFLTKLLGLDWRDGAAWYARLLVDADRANNWGNWKWVAGTGNDPRPGRRFNPIRQALRYDPNGDYVRRWVPELSHVDGGAVHQPWRLPPVQRAALRYDGPLAPKPEDT